jgi:hypothetical protein
VSCRAWSYTPGLPQHRKSDRLTSRKTNNRKTNTLRLTFFRSLLRTTGQNGDIRTTTGSRELLVLPLCCKSLSPLIQRMDRFRIRPIEHMPPVSPRPHQPDLPEHP